MEEDIVVNAYFSDNARFADLINGLVFEGEQVIRKEDLKKEDTQTVSTERYHGTKNGITRTRDQLRRAAFGVHFALIGLENQSQVHYLMPLRTMDYDIGEYLKQADVIKDEVKSVKGKGTVKGEYISRFHKYDRLQPCVTLVLYYGSEEWDGSRDIHGLLDLEGIPKKLRSMVGNYHMNLFEIRKIENTDIFRTDLKLVFDVIRCSEDKGKLKALIGENPAYQHLKRDAYLLIDKYANVKDLIKIKEEDEGDEVNMCKALEDMKEEYL